jgi:hypothetical protein
VPIPSILLVAVENGGASAQFELIYLAAAFLTLLLGIAIPLLRQRAAVSDYLHHLKRR